MRAKRSNGEGSVTRRLLADQKTVSFQAQVYVEDQDGRRRRVTKTFRAEGDAYAWMSTHEADSLLGRRQKVRTITEFGERWLDVMLNNEVTLGRIRPATFEQYRWCWVKHIEPTLGDRRLDLSDLRPSVIDEWLAAKTEATGAHGKPYAPRTIEMMFVTLRRALRDAVAEGYLPRNPAEGLKPPVKVTPMGRPLSRAEARPFIRAALDGDTTHSALWAAMVMLGLRVGEATALHWEDLDLDRHTVSISRTLSRRYAPDPLNPSRRHMTLVEGSAKTAASVAELRLPAALVERLDRHRATQRRARLAARRWDNEALVFATPVGTYLDPRNLARALDKTCSEVGITRHVRLHDLRHTMATLNVGKIDIRVIQRLMRHAHVETTAAIYAQVTQDVLDDAAITLNDTFSALLAQPPSTSKSRPRRRRAS